MFKMSTSSKVLLAVKLWFYPAFWRRDNRILSWLCAFSFTVRYL